MVNPESALAQAAFERIEIETRGFLWHERRPYL
jgi:hypothetical protein